jgi:hypothetical protein
MNVLSLSLFILELSDVLANFMDIIDAEVIDYIENDKKSKRCNCGRKIRLNKILNGHTARPHEYPWQVYLKIHFPFQSKNQISGCGGSLISRKHILSAAHCVLQSYKVQSWTFLSFSANQYLYIYEV